MNANVSAIVNTNLNTESLVPVILWPLEYREFLMRKPPDADQIMSNLLQHSERAAREAEWIDRIGESRIIQTLSSVLTEERCARIDTVVSGRTLTIAPVIEGVLNTGNVSAVMRTAEAMGFQSMHVVTNGQPLKHSERTSQGAYKWLDIHIWESATSCAGALKDQGYRIVVTHLDERAEPLQAFDFTQKTALVFGNELTGISSEMLQAADASCILPISGFVQSYNVSVAAAIALHHAFSRRVQVLGANGDLTEEQMLRLKATFYLRATEKAEDILERTFGSDASSD